MLSFLACVHTRSILTISTCSRDVILDCPESMRMHEVKMMSMPAHSATQSIPIQLKATHLQIRMRMYVCVCACVYIYIYIYIYI
jgi:hypothetical protein